MVVNLFILMHTSSAEERDALHHKTFIIKVELKVELLDKAKALLVSSSRTSNSWTFGQNLTKFDLLEYYGRYKILAKFPCFPTDKLWNDCFLSTDLISCLISYLIAMNTSNQEP